MTLVIKLARNDLPIFWERLRNRPGVVPQETTSRYELFRAQVSGALVVGYTSGKVVANRGDIQPILREAMRGIGPMQDGSLTIGSDEAGKGEWLGPMTVAAVALTQPQAVDLQSRGVMDSKELSLHTIAELAAEVVSKSAAHYVVTISPQKFNTLVSDFAGEEKSLNELLAWGHAKAIENVLEGLGEQGLPTKVVIDEFDRVATERRLRRLLESHQLDVLQMPKAEAVTAVAAASIIAKAKREEWVDRNSRRFGVELRNLNPIEAARRPDFTSLAKVRFLSGIASSESLLSSAIGAMSKGDNNTAILSAFAAIESHLANVLGSGPRGKVNLSGLLREALARGKVSHSLEDQLRLALDIRNAVAHGLGSANAKDTRFVVDVARKLLAELPTAG